MEIAGVIPLLPGTGFFGTDKRYRIVGIVLDRFSAVLSEALRDNAVRFAVQWDVRFKGGEPDKGIIFGVSRNMVRMCAALSRAELPAAEKKNCRQIELALLNWLQPSRVFRCRDYTLRLGRRPCIMGILNVTPDSFSDGGIYFERDKAIARAFELEQEGADIIDIGAESTRPGAGSIAAEEQLRRIEPVVAELAKKLKIPISIDTGNAAVARRCLDLGASIINDIYALTKDARLGPLISRYKAGVVLMHMRRNPRVMQKNPQYRDVTGEITRFLERAKERALSFGIGEDRIALDPGIGFGKTTEHNLRIVHELSRLRILGQPLLIGTSRKSFIGNVLKVPVGGREFGTAASMAYAVMAGADIVRVHNVRQMREVVMMTRAIDTVKE